MRVAFVCLGSPFSPDMLYKENLLIEAACQEGHEVLVIASDSEYQDGVVRRIPAPAIATKDGYKLVRLPYRKMISRRLSEKLRYVPAFRQILSEFDPDLVYFNIPQIPAIKISRQLRQRNSQVRIVCHFTTTSANSGRNALSLNLLHRLLYRGWIKVALPFLDEVFYISDDSADFVVRNYAIPVGDISYLPLPGQVINEDARKRKSRDFRRRLNIPDQDIVFLHGGKMDEGKRTIPILRAFAASSDARFHLLIVGAFSREVADEALDLIAQDPRVEYLGFLNAEDLVAALCSSDLYLQPGTESQTAQTAICCGTPVAVAPYRIYTALLGRSAYFIETDAQLTAMFNSISRSTEQLGPMSTAAYAVARSQLDHRAVFRTVAYSSKAPQ